MDGTRVFYCFIYSCVGVLQGTCAIVWSHWRQGFQSSWKAHPSFFSLLWISVDYFCSAIENLGTRGTCPPPSPDRSMCFTGLTGGPCPTARAGEVLTHHIQVMLLLINSDVLFVCHFPYLLSRGNIQQSKLMCWFFFSAPLDRHIDGQAGSFRNILGAFVLLLRKPFPFCLNV